MKIMKKSEVLERLSELDNWELHGKVLVKEFKFDGFAQGLDFVNKVGAIAEEQDHHPNVLLSYESVVLELITHSVGKLTEKDFKLATAIDEIS